MPNLTGQEGNFDYPGFDYAAQRTKIARKLALSQALQKQGLEQLPVDRQVGGWAIKTSPLEGLAKLAQTYVGAKIGKGVETDQTDLAKTAQSDYRTALSTALKNSGLGQDEIDSLTAAGSNPMAQQMMPFITGIAQQKRQMKMLQDWLGQGGQGVPEAPAGPQPGEGQGYGVVAPPAPGTQPTPPTQGGMGQMPVGFRNVMGGAMLGIPGLSELGKMQHSDAQTRGGVQYDQTGKAYIINNNGQRVDIPGTMARDKPEAVDTGGATQFVNPYQQGAPIPKTLTPMQKIEAPIAQGKYQWETGGNPLGGGAPASIPIPKAGTSTPIGPRAAAAPPVLPGITPKAQAELNATRAADKPSAIAGLSDATNNLDRLAKEVRSIMDDPALSRVTGAMSVIPNMPGSPATNVAARLEAVKSQVAFAVLQAMRNTSKTGGALGQVSNFEEQMLQNNLAAITNTKQSHESMKANLQKILDYAEAAKGRLSKGFRDTYNEEAPITKPYTGDSGKSEMNPPESVNVMTARNPQTGKRIQSKDGGKTWQPLE